ncbi:hypothetical protein MSAN_00775600 [Mycena sanguinolenta]|uniref:Chromo domain-containing protein n=1 Tax=Mycena sanguinolenta TaxID=230812 RepID=A0A8H6Z7T5_9AGAR|nr:hypothetical protein MSAN_00775600 [Mycena sanguinolenta]
MPAPIVAQLQALLGQLEQLDLQDPSQELQQALTAAAEATQAHISHHSNTTIPSPSSLLSREDQVPSLTHTANVVSSETSPAHLSVDAAPSIEFQSSTGPRPAHVPFPSIKVDIGTSQPSQSTYLRAPEFRQFGMPPLRNLIALEPPLHLFVWPASSSSKAGKPVLDKLVPPPPAPPPVAGCYPQAPEYVLNTEIDHSYRRGWRYAAPFFSHDRAQETERMLDIQIPPNVNPTHFDLDSRAFVCEPIPGMVKVPLGVPIVHHVDGDPKRAVTAVCVHSLKTLEEYEEGSRIEELQLIPRLMELTWGREKTETDPGVPGIFALEGMKRNLRSKNIDLSKLAHGDGSFNLASTHGEGEGHGHFSPAVQTNTPEAARIIEEVLQILHQLYRLIMPLSISRFEWEMMEHEGYENNIIAFGGLEPGPSSTQLNSSSAANVFDLNLPEREAEGDAGVSTAPPSPINPAESTSSSNTAHGSKSPAEFQNRLINLVDLLISRLKSADNLDTSIGPQGRQHMDPQDAPAWFTLFVLMLRLPKGSDMGTFLWMRTAVYLREMDQYILFAVFKGQDIHTGTAPTYVKQRKEAMEQFKTDLVYLFTQFGIQVRAAYVAYPSNTATSRSAQIMYTPSLGFVDRPADIRSEIRQYYLTHGDTVLGDSYARANRIAREGAYAVKNYFLQARIDLGQSVDDILAKATYTDENGIVQHLDPVPINVEDDRAYDILCLYRRYFAWWMDVISTYSLGLTKPQFIKRQEAVKQAIAGFGQRPKVLPTERQLVSKPRPTTFTSNQVELIDRIISRELHGSEAMWRVVLQGSSSEILVSEKTQWLIEPSNAAKCLQFYHRHGTGTRSIADEVQHPGSSQSESAQSSHEQIGIQSDVAHGNNGDQEEEDEAAELIVAALGLGNTQNDTGANQSSIVAGHRQCPSILNRNANGTEGNGIFHAASEHEEDNCFEVERIIDWRDQWDGTRQWRVRWAGFDASHDMWLGAEDLREAQTVLDEYNTQNNLPSVDFSSLSVDSPFASPTPSAASSDDEFIPLNGDAQLWRSRRVEKQLNAAAAEEESQPVLNIGYFDKLLDLETLRTDCQEVEYTRSLLMRPSELKKAAESAQAIAERIVDQIERQNDLSTQMYFELSATDSAWGSRLANLTLACMADIGTTLPDLIMRAEIADLVSRGSYGQICRSLIAVYQWLVHLGPSLAEQLTKIRRAEGAEALAKQFPELSPMVEHVLAHVQEHREWQRQVKELKSKPRKPTGPRGRPRTRRVGERATPISEASTSAPAPRHPDTRIPKPTTYSHAPADLWGILPAPATTKIRLEPLSISQSLEDDEQVYEAVAKLICKLWDNHLVLKPMLYVDTALNPVERKRRSELQGVRDRCITRGAILQCLCDSFGDGLFVSKSIRTFLHRPCKLFPKNIARDSHFARAIEGDEVGTLRALDNHLAACIVQEPELIPTCAKLAELVHKGILSLKLQDVLTDDEYDDPQAFLLSERFAKLTTTSSGASKRRQGRPVANVPPTLKTLMPDKPMFGVAAIIIREALSKQRQQTPTADMTLFRRLLTGHYPTTGNVTKCDHDQMNPIRAELEGFQWLKRVLPIPHLTTETGLYSLLAFMSTGQGSSTQDFLSQMEARPNKMHFTTVTECVEAFTVVENKNCMLPEAQKIKCCNPAIYGTANGWYSLTPSLSLGHGKYKPLTMLEKFTPQFSVELGRSYKALLGPLARQSPAETDAPRIRWEDALRWIVGTSLRGFRSGLAPLQFANNLVLADIATPPSAQSMAQWIYLNKGYGAYAGLKVLGFNLPDNASPTAVRAAFFCFYCWLEHFLSDADKKVLHFGTIFTEHLLCKVGRWKNRLQTMAKIDLSAKAREVFEEESWVKGENLLDHTKWPIPAAGRYDVSIFKSIVEKG